MNFLKSVLAILLLSIYLFAQNNALDFDGSNDYVTISDANSLDITTDITLEAWVKLDNVSGNKVVLLKSDGGSAADMSYGLRIVGDEVRFELGGGTGNFDNSGNVAVACLSLNYNLSTGQWYHIAGTRSGSSMILYINGSAEATETISTNSIKTSTADVALGYFPSYGQYFDGQIDEVRIWDDVRTQAEIKANMHTELSGSESNLVAYYKFNESSGTSASDETSNSNDGTLTNIDGSTDWVSANLYAQNYALDFDGTNDYVLINSDAPTFNNTSSFTLEAWIKTSANTSSNYFDEIVSWIIEPNNDASVNNAQFRIINDKLQFGMNTGSWQSVTSSTSINTGNWVHVAVVKNSNSVTLYINGTSDGTGTVSQTLTPDAVYIGAYKQNGSVISSYFNGKLDDVRIWDDVRTATEISDNMYKELTGGESNLVAYYNFNAGRGTSLMDLTTNNHTGTLTNMTSSSDWVSGFELGVTISGNSGFRLMSSPVSGTIFSDLLSELWIQGMTGGDVTDGTANVWTLSGSSWSALTNLSTASLAAGQGFMVYVFSDTDNDGTDDLPVTLSVSGTENSSSATLGSIADGGWGLAGNPYASTIDWDLITKSSISSTCYVWDDATSAYISWNGSTGSLTDGLIAPYQGFWVQASGGTGSITIETSDKASQAGTFYRTMNDSTGSASLTFSSNGYERTIYLSFNGNGNVSLDMADGYQLMPVQMTNHLIAMTYAEETALAINNLPVSYSNDIHMPLDVMMLSVEDQLFQPVEAEGQVSWDLSNLPDGLTLSLVNQATGMTTPLTDGETLSFTTVPKDGFGYPTGTVNHYPLHGDPLFTLTVNQTQMENKDSTIPVTFTLHTPFPNPFNPSTTITFDVPEIQDVSLQIFNVKGQWVETLIQQRMAPGTHTINWGPKEIASGTYLVYLKSGDKTITEKITYIK